MLKMKFRIIQILFLLFPLTIGAQGDNVPPTRYNWTNVANGITEGCTNDYDRVKAIYRWICANISYDTSYSIYHADECWDYKRGVCQAYSELFYQIAGALGIKVYVVSGRSKDRTGSMDGHAWVFAITDRAKNAGVLIDPTWGAGSVNNGVFTRKNDDMSWFHVDPQIMIFTHYPTDQSFQILGSAVSYDDFLKMPPVYPEVLEFGLSANKIMSHCRYGDGELPEFFRYEGKAHFYVESIPMLSTLRPGQTYRFQVRSKSERFALICDNEFVYEKDWTYSNGVYTIDYVVPCGKTLDLSWYDSRKKLYYPSICYKVASPTASDIRNLEAKRPFSMPEIKRLKGINKEYMEEMGFDGRRLLAAVRNGSVTSLPELYQKDALTVVDVPMNGTLRAGQTYRFLIKPKRSGKWAIINNGQWHYNWVKTATGDMLEITVTPQQGVLKVSIQHQSDGSYYGCLEYKVR